MRIGIIGGGQLGMMMAESIETTHHKIIGLDPNQTCPLSNVADEMIIADYNDSWAINELVKKCDIITYEFENVDLNLIEKYKDIIPQGRDALYYSRNRMIEKQFARSLGIKTPKFLDYSNEDLFYPSIVKTKTGGYDGKGQWRYKCETDIDHFDLSDIDNLIIEEYIPFDYEISVVATRDKFGTIIFYPIPKNAHRNGILFTSSVFEDIDDLIVSTAKMYTSKIMEKLQYIGTLAVEFFVKDNEVIFNEFAPRPHNSGHYTIEGCTVSQFKNHMLAIVGEKVEQPKLVSHSIMINVLGQDYAYIERSKGLGVHYHNYYKEASKVNRKMGHITIVSESKEEALKLKNHIIEEQI